MKFSIDKYSTIVIFKWMVADLKLKGNNVMVYSLIYAGCQDGMSRFRGSKKFIAEMIGATSINTVDNIINYLIKKNHIRKFECVDENNVPYCEYEINQKEIEKWA